MTKKEMQAKKAARDMIMVITREAMEIWDRANGSELSKERLDFINLYVSGKVPEEIRKAAI